MGKPAPSSLSFATYNPSEFTGPVSLYNLVGGVWSPAKGTRAIENPLKAGETLFHAPDTTSEELEPFVADMKSCPKSGLHNPFKHPERYRLYGDVTARLAAGLRNPEIADFFAKAIQQVAPKSYTQAEAEVTVTRLFLENFCGDNVRFLAQGTHTPGDHVGQVPSGWRWPFGPVGLVAPFNFPLEIPVLQLMGALYMGNKVVAKGAVPTSSVLEQWIRFMHECGAPKEDITLIHADGPVMGELIEKAELRVTQFTGSSGVAEHLSAQTRGKVRVEDAGFDWKILGPDVGDIDYVVHQADQDAYACSGQKCSAQSLLFVHKNWTSTDLYEKLAARAATRRLDDLTVGPVLTQTTEQMLGHLEKLAALPGARMLWGGKELANHSVPKCYGAIEPSAVFVPLSEMCKPENFDACVTEIFGPVQVITEYDDSELDMVLEACERMSHHLTAAIVSNEPQFVNKIVGSSVNGTTYTGRRARTTGAPQNHWFGPAGDPRAAGIGTAHAIQLVWSCHREVIADVGPVAPADTLKQS